MRFFRGVVLLLAASFGGAQLQASIIPLVHLDEATLKAYQAYVDNFEKTVFDEFHKTGKMWIDNSDCCGKRGAPDTSKPVVQPRRNEDVARGSIHHFSGTLFVKGATIESVRKVMEDYEHYVQIFKPDLGAASGKREADSTPEDEHYTSKLLLVQSTVWMAVNYDTLYDTHYRRPAKDRWTTRSVANYIREWKDTKNQAAGTYPEGDDHGFLWKTNTYWLVRERNGGVDIQADSIALSRTSPMGFGWWGTKRSKDAVDKMLRDVEDAIANLK
jgi:hypothetical protein